MTTLNRYKVWSQAESARAAELWQIHFVDHYGDEEGPTGARHRVFQLIGKDIGRHWSEVSTRLNMKGETYGANQWKRGAIASAQALVDLERRKAAEKLMTVTSVFFGDPPPGFSALDRKRGSR